MDGVAAPDVVATLLGHMLGQGIAQLAGTQRVDRTLLVFEPILPAPLAPAD